MGSISAMVWCLAYAVGLLFTAIPWGGVIALALGIGAAILVPQRWKTAPRRPVWIVAGLIGLLASLYFQARTPKPAATDISRFLPIHQDAAQLVVKVQGRVDSSPHVTRSQRMQFWLTVQQLEIIRGTPGTTADGSRATGKLYVTAPLQQASELHPGQRVGVIGSLYKPKPAANPGAFNFQTYLAQEGSFAGLKGDRVEIPEQGRGWGLWVLQRRIARSHVLGAGSSAGQLLTSIALGKQAVDLPHEIKDAFIQAGLAHALAASGTQVSLILAVVLALTHRLSKRVQVVAGAIALASFVSLAGFEPAILRAALMGAATLLALLIQRKVKSVGLLLLVATILLLCNPLWIWDLGFQLSFLATMGLLVTVPPLLKQLDWLPGAIAAMIVVPIAAALWTLPLQIQVFSVVSTYSILVNILTAPLIAILSIGGMISALAALVWSPAGSTLAGLLKYPTQALIVLVNFFNQLPGHVYAVGTISVLTAIALYALLGLIWLSRWWQQRWWVAVLLGAGLVVLPAWQARATLFRATVLATSGQPVMVLQDGSRVGLINSGDTSTATFSVLPLLNREGVNQLDWAVSLQERVTPTDRQTTTQPGWAAIQRRLPIKRFYHHPGAATLPSQHSGTHLPLSTQAVQLGSTQVRLVNTNPAIAELTLPGKTWIWLGSLSTEQQASLANAGTLPHAHVLWWSGEPLHPDLLAMVRPDVAIASAKTIDPTTSAHFQNSKTSLYYTGRDGAIQWTPADGFQTTLDFNDNRPTPL
ncbi:MAG: DUF4131 domain-containing protein [Leptolyngbyaceae cyanobacterium RU_5_1]|nr:DUF4131 domain-containing protein [Leptolyngbyaceae cyanobacterium RU_5_1]